MVSIVTTTINKPVLLEGYCQNAKKFGHKDVGFIIIGDKKTPDDEVFRFCSKLEKKYSYPVKYYDIKAQRGLLRKFPAVRDHIPYNSIQRRNIGILKAYMEGGDAVVTIDDDNFILPNHDFVGHHKKVGQERNFLCLSSSSGWYNVCEMLKEETGFPIYHRGYPLSQHAAKPAIATRKHKGKIIVNAGLWLDAPDIDALSWLHHPVKATRFKKKYPNGVGLDIDTWSPFNSQNTALAREAVPAYFLSPYLGRYDDIWGSYIVGKIADHLGHYIHFGPPLVKQERNDHNYFVDFDKERFGMEATDDFIKALSTIDLAGLNYKDCFGEVTNHLYKNRRAIFPFYKERFRGTVDKMLEGMHIWHETFKTL